MMNDAPLSLRRGEMTLGFDPRTLMLTIDADGARWQTQEDTPPCLTLADDSLLPFGAARRVVHTLHETGLGPGIRSLYDDFPGIGLSFETWLWLDGEGLRAELIPLEDPQGLLKAVVFPAPFAFEEQDRDHYTALPYRQGLLLPNDWARSASRDIQYYGYYGYMPWFGQVAGGQGYIAITDTPCDGGCRLDAEPGRGKHAAPLWLPCLGRIGYRRQVRYQFISGDYNDLCKCYRRHVALLGRLATLSQKAERCPGLFGLIGSAVVHEGICTHIVPASRYYDAEHPEKNDRLVPFETRRRQMEDLRERHGVPKAYLHLDGWGTRGYDNLHPDYLPPCEAAGGWEGLAALAKTVQELGYLFATHDQYRDYYFDAPTFSLDNAVQNADGSHPENTLWAGGRQAALCATQAPDYVRRNFTELAAHGIRLDGTYLDCFTCDPPNECANPRHPMTRAQCISYWQQCLAYCMSQGILPSSEEANDWCIPHMTHCHYAPYAMDGEGNAVGIPVPLYGLVYHDCLIIPWNEHSVPAGQSERLHCLLNAGAPYLPIEPTDREAADCREAARLQQACAMSEMTSHRFLPDGRQRTQYANGVSVTVDFGKGSVEIEGL